MKAAETFLDVLICEPATETVKSVAGYGLPLEANGSRPSAAALFVEILPNLRDTLFLEMAEAGKYRPGDKLEPDEHRAARINSMVLETPVRSKKPSRKGDGYGALQKLRMANCQCIRCGSANLANAIHCEPCAQLNRERVSKSAAKSL